jgi:hypothetical protein
VNDRLEESVEALKAILVGERLKRSGIQTFSAEQKVLLAKTDSCLLELEVVRNRVQPILASFKEVVQSER